MSVDYNDLKKRGSETTFYGKQLEKYYNKRRDSFDLLLREDRFGRVLEISEDLQERDADQILEASLTDIDMEEVLNGYYS